MVEDPVNELEEDIQDEIEMTDIGHLNEDYMDGQYYEEDAEDNF